MSTFNGVVTEFPRISIDYFNSVVGNPPPLAYFLSHVHTDHTKGMESYKSPAFIYCSAATKELLLRMEKRPKRNQFDACILEQKERHFKHLKTVLRPLPLNTPTVIEITVNRKLAVTLLDANHCPGAVMFLLDDGRKSVLYTGDIRAEAWWLEALIRNPTIVQYSCGLHTLDNIYLDTTFASARLTDHRVFPSKADGMRKLIREVSRYPEDTIFHISTGCSGFEDALACLAATFSSNVHGQRYEVEYYQALSSCSGAVSHPEGTFLSGFKLGWDWHSGFLTEDENSRFHICRPQCSTIKSSTNTVHIRPEVCSGMCELDDDFPEDEVILPFKNTSLPNMFYFPFSRHSSFDELCKLVAAFSPKEVYPCVWDQKWTPENSIETHFGQWCSGNNFKFDETMARKFSARLDLSQEQDATQLTGDSSHTSGDDSYSSSVGQISPSRSQKSRDAILSKRKATSISPINVNNHLSQKRQKSQPPKRGSTRPEESKPKNHMGVAGIVNDNAFEDSDAPKSQLTIHDVDFGSQSSHISDAAILAHRNERRKEAYRAAKENDGQGWSVYSNFTASVNFASSDSPALDEELR